MLFSFAVCGIRPDVRFRPYYSEPGHIVKAFINHCSKVDAIPLIAYIISQEFPRMPTAPENESLPVPVNRHQ